MKQMAIMRHVTFGLQPDCGKVGLSFFVYLDESSAYNQFIADEKALGIIKKFGVEDIKNLNGKPCWVEVSESDYVRFLEPCVIS